MIADTIAHVGHQVHVCRVLEARPLLRWLGPLRGKRVLDVAGGDGYWAGQARRRGATAVCLDIAGHKLVRGRGYASAPMLVQGDALRLPFADGTFDAIMSVCAIEHFPDGAASLDEMARVLRPGGQLVMSADVLSRGAQWPELDAEHRRRYHVVDTYPDTRLRALLAERGLDVAEHRYIFRSQAAEHLYMWLSAKGGKVGWNAAAPLAPWVAWNDRRSPNEQGSVVLVRAVKRSASS